MFLHWSTVTLLDKKCLNIQLTTRLAMFIAVAMANRVDSMHLLTKRLAMSLAFWLIASWKVLCTTILAPAKRVPWMNSSENWNKTKIQTLCPVRQNVALCSNHCKSRSETESENYNSQIYTIIIMVDCCGVQIWKHVCLWSVTVEKKMIWFYSSHTQQNVKTVILV